MKLIIKDDYKEPKLLSHFTDQVLNNLFIDSVAIV